MSATIQIPQYNVVNKPFESEMVDVMGGNARREIPVHGDGLVALVDVMPRLVPAATNTADFAIVQAARTSYGEGTRKVSEDHGLIRYLLRHRHTTPFEMVEFKFHHIMPIFVARQWIRHRTANVNEYSARYSIVKDRFYRPEKGALRIQDPNNKQGGVEIADDITAAEFEEYLAESEALYAKYKHLVDDRNVSREQARIGLPVSLYTEWYWKIDLHNLLHFLGLRMDAHAQQEIRDYAYPMFALIQPIVPIACQAFLDYQFGAMTLSALEIEALKSGGPLVTGNKREADEWQQKQRCLGIVSG